MAILCVISRPFFSFCDIHHPNRQKQSGKQYVLDPAVRRQRWLYLRASCAPGDNPISHSKQHLNYITERYT